MNFSFDGSSLRVRNALKISVLTLFAGVPATAPASLLDLCVNGSSDALPSGAYTLAATSATSLQSALDNNIVVRLEPGADYSAAGPITLRTGQKLFGLRNKVGKITVAPGTRDAVLSGLDHTDLEFPPSSAVTRRNCFNRLDGPITITGAKLEQNVFVSLERATLTIDTRAGGYWRNNRLIRWMSHTAIPAANILGDSARNSYGNVLLWSNVLVPGASPNDQNKIRIGVHVADQRDITLVGTDMESWKLTTEAGYTFERGGVLRLFRPTGFSGVVGSTGYLDVAMDELQLYNWELFSANPPAPQIRLRATNRRSVLIDPWTVDYWSVQDEASGAFRFSAFDTRPPLDPKIGFDKNIPGAELAGVPISASLSPADQTKLMRAFAASRSGSPWERPLFRAIPDPAGPNWKAGLANKPDSGAYIQSLIDTQGIARLPSGTYYVSQPLLLKRGQGIVGDGATRTVIVAKGDIDIIRGAEHIDTGLEPTSFVLADVTLQGGKNGIHHDASGSGGGAQYTLITLSHVTFRDMSEAGIFIDGIFGWDNNFIDEVNFVRCKSALKQRVAAYPGQGDVPGLAYLDKNVFYRSQFEESGDVALDMQGARISSTNHFINSSFRNNNRAARLINWPSTVFANCDFINNGGAPTLAAGWSPDLAGTAKGFSPYLGGLNIVAGCFKAGARGSAMLGYGSTCEGCTFELDGSTSATVLSPGTRAFFYNSTSRNMPLGGLTEGLSINSAWPLDASINQKAVVVTSSGVTVLVPGLPAPVPQLLFGNAWY